MSTTFKVRNHCFNVPTYRETAPDWAKPVINSDDTCYTTIEIPDDVVIIKEERYYNFFIYLNANTIEDGYHSNFCYFFYHSDNNKMFGYAIPRYGLIEAISFFKITY